AVHGIVNIDCKKRSEVESATFNFHIKKVSAYGVDNDIMEEIHKFPLPFQNLLIREACSIINRLEKGKGTPGLTSLDCHCLFYNRHLLPCKHIFHENMYGNKLLTAEVWKRFQEMFEESGFE
ncbi:3038_t:CDS:1, partial [Dentiscutata erythropus]